MDGVTRVHTCVCVGVVEVVEQAVQGHVVRLLGKKRSASTGT